MADCALRVRDRVQARVDYSDWAIARTVALLAMCGAVYQFGNEQLYIEVIKAAAAVTFVRIAASFVTETSRECDRRRYVPLNGHVMLFTSAALLLARKQVLGPSWIAYVAISLYAMFNVAAHATFTADAAMSVVITHLIVSKLT